MIETSAIVLDRVSLRRGETWILRDVSWRIEPGTCCAILGPNGSGKSTLARIISCYLWPTTGRVSVLGNRFGEVDLRSVRREIRLVQPAGPYDVDATLTTREVVLSGYFSTLGLYDRTTAKMRSEAQRVLEQVGLGRVADHAYATLSSGERIRSLVARALVVRPRLLLLDEPTAGLDLLGREQVLATVQAMFNASEAQPRTTVVLITHHVEELPPATEEVLLLDEGAIAVSGRPTEVLRPEVLSRVYRCRMDVSESGGRYWVRVDPEAWRGLLPQ